MKRTILLASCVAIAALAAGIGIGRAQGQAQGKVYELRKYYALEGRADAMHARFRDHTMKLFEKHGMTNIGYWVPAEPKEGDAALIYIVAHANRAQADANWKAFASDPDWQAVQKASEADGKIVAKVEREYLNPTDYSQLK